MAEPDNALMLEILKDIRKDVTDVRKDVTGIRKEQDNHRTLLLMTVDNLRRLQLFTEQKFLEVDNRFNAIDKRFNDVDKRFNAIDNRFNDVDKRFNAIDIRFNGIDGRFTDVDKRFLDMQEHMKAHKDDLEMMLKAELLGAMSNYRIKIENYVHERLSEKGEQPP
jgi:septation ring formation regulator EzrA